MKTILIFPSSLNASAWFAAEAKATGYATVGAASVDHDPVAAQYDRWVYLPYINDLEFFPQLRSIVEQFGINGIYTPHAPSYLFLFQHLATHLPQIRLIGDSPYARQMRWIRNSQARTDTATNRSAAPHGPEPTWVAAVCAHADCIYGECSEEKILALCSIFSSTPRGDVVEIGGFFGKSAYILNRLAVRYRTGLTLVIDPWALETSVQRDSPPFIEALSRVWDWNLVFQGFLLTMQACAIPPFNYVRATSAEAAAQYYSGAAVITPEFGRTDLAGSISVLHIDGNHDEEAVAQDFALWSAKLACGGWIIFDDYEWSLGEGPRKVADRAIATYGGKVCRRFVAGGALFLKVSN